MGNLIVHVSDSSFETDVIGSSVPVLVDFWAEWCGPCKAIAPFLDKIAVDNMGKLTVAKVNVDSNPDTAARFGIRGIPTLMLFRNGVNISTKVGALTESQLVAWINTTL